MRGDAIGLKRHVSVKYGVERVRVLAFDDMDLLWKTINVCLEMAGQHGKRSPTDEHTL
jgi:hypothetical protein